MILDKDVSIVLKNGKIKSKYIFPSGINIKNVVDLYCYDKVNSNILDNESKTRFLGMFISLKLEQIKKRYCE